jgi:hypothetical protein
MDARSLAIVFTPCLFSVEEEDFSSKNPDSKSKSLESKLDVVQTLISNASRVIYSTFSRFSDETFC